MTGGTTQTTAMAANDAAQKLAEAHRALRADPSIQFAITPPPPPPPPPAWLKSVASFFEWLGNLLGPVGRVFDWISSFMPNAPYARILLWGVIAIALAALVWLIVERVRTGEWRMPRKRARAAKAVAIEAEEDAWLPDAAKGRAWLDEADALAAQGLYAQAVHHLLFRSIEDIQRLRPQIVRPALTSRELAAAPGIPGSARALFAGIARYVERSLFGGRDVSVDDWQTARASYADFALPGTWRV